MSWHGNILERLVRQVFVLITCPGSHDPAGGMPKRRRAAFPSAVLVCLGLLDMSAALQEPALPENPLQGRRVFEQKGCSHCHAVSGTGGGVGPDLGQNRFYGSYLEVASVMWNHLPLMLRSMHDLGLPYPRMSNREMNELIAYIYYQRFLGDPGDLYRGRRLAVEKGCLGCHSVGGKGGDSAPPFDQLARFVSPLFMAQALWNHGPAMEDELRNRGLTRPRFEKGEIVDLGAYIRAATAGGSREQVYMAPGNPNRGRKVLGEKQCLTCHALDGTGGTEAIDFNDLQWNLSVSEIAGLMWNHSLAMQSLMSARQINWPQFQGAEMADLISFLYFLGFQDKPGDSNHGKKLFSEKGCAQCHSSVQTAVSKSLSSRLNVSLDLAAALWNHAPVVERKVIESNFAWPQLNGRELADLAAFIQVGSSRGDHP